MGRFQPSSVVWQREDFEAAGLFVKLKKKGLYISKTLHPYPLLNHTVPLNSCQTLVSQLFVRRHVAFSFEPFEPNITSGHPSFTWYKREQVK